VRCHRLGHRVLDASLVIGVNEREPMFGIGDIVFRLPSQERLDLRADIDNGRRHPCKNAVNVGDCRDRLDQRLVLALGGRLPWSGKHATCIVS
jgi:hypothetical protein